MRPFADYPKGKGVFILKISKKSIIVITTYIIAAFALVGGFMLKQNISSSSYKRQTAVDYTRAFSALSDSTQNMSDSLKKVCVASSPSLISSTCAEVYAEAKSAEAALSVLPYANEELEHTAAFISKTGDYVFYISRSCASGNSLSDEERQNLEALCQSAESVADTLSSLSAQLLSGSISISELEKKQDVLSGTEDSMVSSGFADSFKAMETEFPELPSLIYDGPFSSHISSMEPKLLEGRKEISEEDILFIAEDFSGIDRNRLSIEYARESDVPVYVVTAKTGSITQTFEITKTGGFIMYYGTNRSVSRTSLSQDEAISRAQSFLKSRGLSNMQMTYYEVQNNILIANFAYSKNGVIYYPDLVKVGIAMDNGEVMSFESEGYIMNHTERSPGTISVSRETAEAALSNTLAVIGYNTCVIPTSGKNELLCHEFKCEYSDGSHCLVYVNAETGAEEKILILLENENGTLTV